MESFENRVKAANQKHLQKEQEKLALEAQKAEQERQNIERAKLLGEEVVRFLLASKLSPRPMYRSVVNGKEWVPPGESRGLRGVQKTGGFHRDTYGHEVSATGWHIYTTGYTDEGNTRISNTGIDEDGNLLDIEFKKIDKVKSLEIIGNYKPEHSIATIESDWFAESIEHLVRTRTPIRRTK